MKVFSNLLTDGILEELCDFSQPFMCGYDVTNQSQMYRWVRHSGSTPTELTGPKIDTSNGGKPLLRYILCALENQKYI